MAFGSERSGARPWSFDHTIFCCFFRLYSPLPRAHSGQGTRGPHWNRPCSTRTPISVVTQHTTLSTSSHIFHPTQTFFPNYPINWIRVTIYGDQRMMPLGQLPAIAAHDQLAVPKERSAEDQKCSRASRKASSRTFSEKI